jgi:hypothetical protein
MPTYKIVVEFQQQLRNVPVCSRVQNKDSTRLIIRQVVHEY